MQGLRVEGHEANFFREWKAMIAYAWTQQNWRYTAIGNHRSDDELFRHLMGFNNFGHGYFEDNKYRAYVKNMKPEYDKWIESFFPHRTCKYFCVMQAGNIICNSSVEAVGLRIGWRSG